MKIRTALAVVGMASTAWMIAINVEPARAQPNQADGWPNDWPKWPDWPKDPNAPLYIALATGVVREQCRRVVEHGDGGSEREAVSNARRRCDAAGDWGSRRALGRGLSPVYPWCAVVCGGVFRPPSQTATLAQLG
jgi:hypothetical protein